jgi:tetraacyldisaccharide 4'-kinase
MNTPRFWYTPTDDAMASLMAGLLSPLSYVFKAGTAVRRLLAKPYRARVPVICVGNVVAGGAGKTPTALAVARLLKSKGQKPVFVTRGYGGKLTSGSAVVYIDPTQHEAADVGDEALLLAAMAPTWAGRDRVAAIRQAESHGTIIIMDDGMQNPHILPTASLLVVDGDVGIGNGRIIPAGPLRETFDDAVVRVNALIIIGGNDRQKLAERTKKPAYRAQLKPNLPFGFPRNDRFVAFAGIARPEKFYATARALGLDIAETCDFPDHHPFDQDDLDALRLRAEEQGALLLTTEKDAVRLPPEFRAETVILPVNLVFDDPEAEEVLAGLGRDLI